MPCDYRDFRLPHNQSRSDKGILTDLIGKNMISVIAAAAGGARNGDAQKEGDFDEYSSL